ncbi:AMP-binding enzyme [Alteribacillus persepolensis]|nr:hypothetical protein [Alteribacillus persepolensis]
MKEILNQHEHIQQSVVVSVPDELRGESVTAYIVKDVPLLPQKF